MVVPMRLGRPMWHTRDMRVPGPISVVLMLLVGLAIHAWGQTRGIEVAVKADTGSIESVRL